MALFDDIPDVIADVLNDADLGFQTVTLTSVTAGTYDPATGTTTGGSTSSATVPAVVEDYKGLALLNGLIQAGDKKVTVAAANLTTAPKPTDTLTAGGIAYAVVNVVTVQPGSVAVIYEIQARRA
jgi:hypothetical protein